MNNFNVNGTPEAVAALFAALDIARSKATAVRKASESNLGAYASSEHVMVCARLALSETGLSVTPADSNLDPEGMVLERGYLVGHSQGAWYRASMSWPVLGRPDVSKGTGSTETMAFSYFLRTLLMMPRMASDDMDNPGIRMAMKASHAVKEWRPSIPMESIVEAGDEGRGESSQTPAMPPQKPNAASSPEAAPAATFDFDESARLDREDNE